MQDDIKQVKGRFVHFIVLIVAVMLGLLLTTLCYFISFGLRRSMVNPLAYSIIMDGIIKRCLGLFILGLIVFALIAVFVARWMVKPIEEAWNEQKQFVSDASHELKTPLTVITTNAELLQSGDLSVQDYDRYSGNILTVAKSMRTLIESLLNLARIEKGGSAGFAKIDFSDVCKRMSMQFEPVMFEKGLNLVEIIDDGIFVMGSDQKLLQLNSILLDNAAKYAKGGDVIISLHLHGKNVSLIVENESEALTEIQLKDIFKRFYRADESHTDKDSYGLGLSIARSICDAHSGKIHAEYSNGKIKLIANIPIV